MLDAPLVQKCDAVGKSKRFLLVVSDENRSQPEFSVNIQKRGSKFAAHLCIQCSKWLVEKQNSGLASKRPRERNPLPLTARKLVWVAVRERGKLDKLEKIFNSPCDCPFVAALNGVPSRSVRMRHSGTTVM